MEIAELKSSLEYDPDSGLFTKSGQPTGSALNRGGGRKYIRIYVRGEYFYAHRLAWLFMTGGWPSDCVDHINGDGADNRWCNLRAATIQQNVRNRREKKNKLFPLKGVCPHVTGGYRSYISVNGKQKSLGYFKCPAAAHFAYVVAADEYFGEFANAGTYQRK